MNSKPVIVTAAIIAVGLMLGFLVLRTEKRASSDDHGQGHAHGHDDGDEHDEGHSEDHGEEPEFGPHRGRVLRDGKLALELSIFETGVSPQFRAYLYTGGGKDEKDDKDGDGEKAGNDLGKAQVAGSSLTVELHRLGGRIDTIPFAAQGNLLLGSRTVEEPHSFDVKVRLERNGASHRWEYSQVEGRVEMEPESMRASGIEVETAGPAVMKSTLDLNGKIMPNEDRLAHIFARFPGVVKEVRKHLGETVRKGETLAIVESNESLEAVFRGIADRGNRDPQARDRGRNRGRGRGAFRHHGSEFRLGRFQRIPPRLPPPAQGTEGDRGRGRRQRNGYRGAGLPLPHRGRAYPDHDGQGPAPQLRRPMAPGAFHQRQGHPVGVQGTRRGQGGGPADLSGIGTWYS